MRFGPVWAALIPIVLSACAHDLVLDFGKGDSVRLVGMADNFDCDDPAYAKVARLKHLPFSSQTGQRKDFVD